MNYLLLTLLSYIIGTSSMSYYISKIHHIDMKKNGSGNLGASNTVALIGWKAGILVAFHDVLKAIIAMIIAIIFFKTCMYAMYIAGTSCIIGHIFPFYLKFKGGKGLASYVGMALVIHPLFGLAVIVIILLLTFITDYVVIGTLSALTIIPIYVYITTKDLIPLLICLIPSIVMIFKHIDNIKRIINGTEIGLRSANKGNHRIKGTD